MPGMGDDGDGLRAGPVKGTDRDGDTLVVRLTGELDLYNADELRAAVYGAAEEGPGRLVIDLSGVDFIDSTALGTILKAAAQLDESGANLGVVAPEGPVRRLLEMTNLTQRFRVFSTRADALAAHAAPA